MYIFPAIDLLGGKVVRLKKGDYAQAKEYEISPEKAAENFISCGARHIHAVDLDGAKKGFAVNAAAVKSIISSTNAFLEIGGGVREEKQIEDYLSAGAGRVILGTAAIKDKSFLIKAVKEYKDKIAVGVDAVNGKAAVSGWLEITNVNAFDFCRYLRDIGVQNVIYTDISRDGTLSGTNLQAYEKLAEIENLKITASGGICSVEEIKKLKQTGVYSAILGKALYEGVIDLQQAVKAAEE